MTIFVLSHSVLRRYLQHVLPAGRHRVRTFGWMHPPARRRLRIVETRLAKPRSYRGA